MPRVSFPATAGNPGIHGIRSWRRALRWNRWLGTPACARQGSLGRNDGAAESIPRFEIVMARGDWSAVAQRAKSEATKQSRTESHPGSRLLRCTYNAALEP